MPLKRLTIRNFQCHKKLVIDLSPTITTITGPSDAGKTSILRAVRLCCLNRPSGRSFVRHGAAACIVLLSTDKLEVGVRVPKTGSTRFRSTLLGGGCSKPGTQRHKLFSAVGAAKVPDEIARILNIGDVNFARQLDPHFWFTLTGGGLSKALNGIINLGTIDSALANIRAAHTKARTREAIAGERLAAARAKKRELAWAVEFDADLTAIETESTHLEKERFKTARLKTLISQMWVAKRSADKTVPTLTRLDARRAEADALAESNRGLALLIDGIKQAKERVCNAEKDLERAGTSLRRLSKGRCPLCGTKGSLLSSLATSTSPPPLRRLVRRPTGTASRPHTFANCGH